MFMGDKETFKFLLLFHGNGYNPEIISRWILLAQSWTSSQATAEKRARQIQFVRGLSCKIRSAMYRSSVPYYSRSAGYSTAGTRRSANDYTRGTEPLSSLVYSSLNNSRYASQPISTTLSSTCPSASSSASGVISSVVSVPETSSTQAGGASSEGNSVRVINLEELCNSRLDR